MIEAFLQGATTLFQPMMLLTIFVAVLMGLIVGILPGVGAMQVCAISLAFIYKMPPEIAMGFLVGVLSTTFMGGSITSILLNIPGGPPNAMTCLDGYPMNQKGEGGRAIGAAVMSSMAGGVLPVLLALAMIPMVAPIVLAFRSPEMCLLVIVGLSFIATVAAGSPIKGMISGLLGIMVSFIGFQGLSGEDRFTFGSLFLYGGLDIIPVATGVFGVSELIDIIIKGQVTIAVEPIRGGMKGVTQGIKDVYVHKWLWLRSTLIGYIIGVLPGVGAASTMVVAYGHAKQSSKNSETFGTGRVEGVIAPESAISAGVSGDLLTTMCFGIPGSASMAILIGAFLLVGVIPGPTMLKEHLPLTFTLLLGVAVSNILGGIICLWSAPYLMKVAKVNIDFLFVAVLVIAFVAVFVVANSMANVIVMVVFGLLGLALSRFGYSRAPLVLGFVLGGLFEFYLHRSIKIFGPTFFLEPISLVLLILVIGVFSYPYLKPFLMGLKRRTKKA